MADLILFYDAARFALAAGTLAGGKRCLSPPNSTQGWALSQKISIPGLIQLASSSVPMESFRDMVAPNGY